MCYILTLKIINERAHVKKSAAVRSIWAAMIAVAILAIAWSSLSGSSGQVSLHWSHSAPFPEPTSGYGAGVIHGEIVLAGGTYWVGAPHHWTQKIFSATTYMFDPPTERWQKLSDEPVPLGYAASAVINDKLFVIGGYTGQRASRLIFTLTKEQTHYVWKKFGDLPAGRVFAQAVAVGNNIYLLGGLTDFEPMDAIGTCCTTRTATNTLMVLDTTKAGVEWRELAPYPGGKRWNFTAATDGNYLWMFGGQYRADVKASAHNFTEVLRYELKTGRWTVVGNLPKDLSADTFVSPVETPGKMILISGMKKVWELNLQTLKYVELTPLPAAVYIDKFVLMGNRLIGAGGENADSEGPRRRSDSTFVGQFLPR